MGTRIAIATFDAQVKTSFVWKTYSPPWGSGVNGMLILNVNIQRKVGVRKGNGEKRIKNKVSV